jgi:hypothetical protein
MVFGSIISSPRATLSLHPVLDLSDVYLENARKAADPNIVLILCHDTLSQVNSTICEGVTSLYVGPGELLDAHGRRSEAQASYKKSVMWV